MDFIKKTERDRFFIKVGINTKKHNKKVVVSNHNVLMNIFFQMSTSKNRINKLKLLDYIYSYEVEELDFVRKHKGFFITILKKLEELRKDIKDDELVIFNVDYYLQIFEREFNITFPSP